MLSCFRSVKDRLPPFSETECPARPASLAWHGLKPIHLPPRRCKRNVRERKSVSNALVDPRRHHCL